MSIYELEKEAGLPTGTIVGEAVAKVIANAPDSKFAKHVKHTEPTNPYTCYGCGREASVERTKPGKYLCNECLKIWESGKFYPRPKLTDSNKSILVLHITTSFGKRYTCRTVEELETYIDNVKKEKKLKRDEDVDIQIGFGRMTKAAYDALPVCKYFIKT